MEMDAEHIARSTRDLLETADELQRWLAQELPTGSNPVITEAVSPESNGMSSETLLVTASWSESHARSEHRLVARMEPPGDAWPVFTNYDLGRQFRVMRLVREHTAVPAPETHWYEPDPRVLGSPFLVMDRTEGLVPPDVPPYTFADNWVLDASEADRRTLRDSAIRALAGVHAITPDAYDLKSLEHDLPGETSLERSVHHWRQYHDTVVGDEPSPLLAECSDWVIDNLPTDAHGDALSWGDPRIGNMMFRDLEVVAVLDWEMVEVAPPEVDVGGCATSTCSSTTSPCNSVRPGFHTCCDRSTYAGRTAMPRADPSAISDGISRMPQFATPST